MKKQTFSETLAAIGEAFEQTVKAGVLIIGKESRWRSENVIEIKDHDLQYHLSGGRYLAEISANKLIDDSGYDYDFTSLPYDERAALGDYINSLINLLK